MSTVTPNLGLVLPSNSEKVSRVIINTNNERIDAAFGTAGAKVYTVELAVSNVSGAYEGRVDDDVITAQMSANRLYIVDPSVFNDIITVTCYDGYLTLACDDVAGDTTVEITVIKEAVDPTQITSTEFDILNNRIGDLSTLDTTNKSNVVNAVNEVKAGVDTNSDAITNLNNKVGTVSYSPLSINSGFTGTAYVGRYGSIRTITGAIQANASGAGQIIASVGSTDKPPIEIKAPCTGFMLGGQCEIILTVNGNLQMNVPSGATNNTAKFCFTYFVQ